MALDTGISTGGGGGGGGADPTTILASDFPDLQAAVDSANGGETVQLSTGDNDIQSIDVPVRLKGAGAGLSNIINSQNNPIQVTVPGVKIEEATIVEDIGTAPSPPATDFTIENCILGDGLSGLSIILNAPYGQIVDCQGQPGPVSIDIDSNVSTCIIDSTYGVDITDNNGGNTIGETNAGRTTGGFN